MSIFSPRVVNVIVNQDLRGSGVRDDPYRRITQYLDFDGNILAEAVDECAAQKNAELAATTANKPLNAIALLSELMACYKNDCTCNNWVCANKDRINAVVAQQQ